MKNLEIRKKNNNFWQIINNQILKRKPICLFDFSDREGETDIVYIGHTIEPMDVDFIRRKAGAPLTVYLSGKFLNSIGIVTFPKLVAQANINGTYRALIRNNREHDPRFALLLDARDNFTGCSAFESAHTIQVLFTLLIKSTQMDEEELANEFGHLLRTPGHIPVIAGAKNLLEERKGHTELALSLAIKFGLPEFAVASELIDPDTLKSMKYRKAIQFAKKHDLPFVTGDEVFSFMFPKL